jgi:hypothetical protein
MSIALFFQNSVILFIVNAILTAKEYTTKMEKYVADYVNGRKSSIFLGAMGFCTVTFFLRGSRVGRDQIPYYTVHVTDGWDELADIVSSWEPCRYSKRPQLAGAYRVKSFQKGTS